MSNKRGSLFNQGKPENPYEERDEPGETPRKATAAQMATRKIKSAKGPRRLPGMTSGISPTPSFGGPQGFGGGDNSASNANPFSFLGQSQQQPTQNGGAFGGSATNSFPPTQSSAPSGTFANSSFPTFGGNNGSTGFNPQPPSAGTFDFTAGSSNAFGASSPAPTTNGTGSGGFSGSLFNIPGSQSQQSSTPFGGIAQSNASTSAPSGGLFGTSSAPQNSFFGGFGSGDQNSATTTTAAPNTFGSFGSGAQNNTATTTAAPSNPFAALSVPSSLASTPFSFGGTAQLASTAQDKASTLTPTLFGSVTSAGTKVLSADTSASTPFAGFGMTQAEHNSIPASVPGLLPSAGVSIEPASTSTPTATPGFSIFGASSQGESATTPAPVAPMFKSFGTSTPAAKPETSAFTGFGASSQPESTSTPLAASNPFKLNSAAENKDTPTTPAGSLFGTSASKPNLFAGFGTTPQANDTPSAAQENTALSTTTPAKNAPFDFGTPQVASKESENTTKEPETAAPKVTYGKGIFSTSQAPKTSGLFSQHFPPTPLAENAFKPSTSLGKKTEATKSTPASLFSQQPQTGTPKSDTVQKAPFTLGSFGQQKAATSSSETAKDTAAQKSESSSSSLVPPKDLQPTPSPSFFGRPPSPSKGQAPLSPASSMPTLTGAAAPPPEAPKAAETHKIPKFHVPKGWMASSVGGTDINGLTVQLASINQNYRAKLAQLPPTADWSSLSQWHHKETSEIMKKIAAIKKQAANAKGITGNESSLSTKRKADDEAAHTTQEASPSKKPRGGDIPSTPASKSTSLLSTTPKVTPPASQTSNLFGNILNKSSSGPSGTASMSKATEKKEPEPATSKQSEVSKVTSSQSPFKFPGFGGASSTGGSSGGLFGQFAKGAKTAEELRAERKEKAKAEDYDSEDETEEEWSARYDREEADRLAKERERDAQAQGPTPSPTSNDVSSTPKLFSGFSKPTSGASTPALFGSRLGSPAPSNGAGKSVFDTPEAASTPPSGGIFDHLSPAASPNNQEDDEDEDDDGDGIGFDEEQNEQLSDSQSQAGQRSDSSDARKRKHDESESDIDETIEEVMRRKKQDTSQKPSLFSRITKGNSPAEGDESEKEDSNGDSSVSLFSQTNGVQTPAKKTFFFDFQSAASKSAPPKQDTFAGDQTFKPGTPIKFGTTKKDNPTFSFQPATPSPAEITATPAPVKPASTFAFLNAGSSGPASISPSVLSSRAPTPLSEAETSGKDSAAENEDDDGQKQEQLDLSALTAEEKAENDILFYTEQALCKHQVDKSGEKGWDNYARGPLWILKNRGSGRAYVRMRLSSGATPLNYNIFPKLETAVTGKSKKMISAVAQKKDGKVGNVFFAVKTPEIAEEFSKVYNDNMPS